MKLSLKPLIPLAVISFWGLNYTAANFDIEGFSRPPMTSGEHALLFVLTICTLNYSAED
jgi:hypothetical protein